MTKIRVGIIFGGRSKEHAVSLQSAKNIIEAIDRKYFDTVLLGIDKYGSWYLHDAENYLVHDDDLSRIAMTDSMCKIAILPGYQNYPLIHANQPNIFCQLDIIFPIIHGTFGEDGSLQGLLRIVNLPYVGSGVLGSAISMDKDITKRLLRDAGLEVAPFIVVSRSQKESIKFEQVSASLGLPVFVKPANQGSSVGVSKAIDRESFIKAIAQAFHFDHKVLVEKAIVGRELECAILGNDKPKVSLCGEIVLNNDFYSYHTKYIHKKGIKIIIPAVINCAISNEIRYNALLAFKTLNCAGMARVDMFLTPNNKVVINEVNTLPGFTNFSTYPKLWQASGLNYTNLITRLIMLALERQRNDYQLDNP